MACILYIFPHPDDESFGPAPGIARQRRDEHDVYLLTLTRGEATSQRDKYGFTKAEMGAVRYHEMQDVASALDLTGLTVLDYPDGELAELDPLDLERAVRLHIQQIQPQVVVTYPVHGISGHPDHLVAHAVVKRIFCDLRQAGAPYLKRLAFLTLREPGDEQRPSHLKGSPDEAIDCVVTFTDEDLIRAKDALACYETYQDVVRAHDPLAQVAEGVPYELYQEQPRPRLSELCEGLEENGPESTGSPIP